MFKDSLPGRKNLLGASSIKSALSMSSSPVKGTLRICSNNSLNLNISRANAAMAGLVDEPDLYTIKGTAGRPKTIRLSRSLVVWE